MRLRNRLTNWGHKRLSMNIQANWSTSCDFWSLDVFYNRNVDISFCFVFFSSAMYQIDHGSRWMESWTMSILGLMECMVATQIMKSTSEMKMKMSKYHNWTIMWTTPPWPWKCWNCTTSVMVFEELLKSNVKHLILVLFPNESLLFSVGSSLVVSCRCAVLEKMSSGEPMGTMKSTRGKVCTKH